MNELSEGFINLKNSLTEQFENDIENLVEETREHYFEEAVREMIDTYYNTEEYEIDRDECISIVEENGGINTLMNINEYIYEYWSDIVGGHYEYYHDIHKVINLFRYAIVHQYDSTEYWNKNYAENLIQ